MGQAKNRGTPEQRKAIAEAKLELEAAARRRQLELHLPPSPIRQVSLTGAILAASGIILIEEKKP